MKYHFQKTLKVLALFVFNLDSNVVQQIILNIRIIIIKIIRKSKD